MKQQFAFYLYLVILLAFPSYALTDSYKQPFDGINIICGKKGSYFREAKNHSFFSFTSTKVIYTYVALKDDKFTKHQSFSKLNIFENSLEWRMLKWNFSVNRSTLISTIKEIGFDDVEMQCEIIELERLNYLISELIKEKQKQYDEFKVKRKL